MELPPLPPLTNEQQEDRVIHHDIAQRMMARALKFETGQLYVGTRFRQPVSLSKNRSKASARLDTSAAIADHLRRRIMVLCAGVIGEAHWFNTIPDFEMQPDHLSSVYENGVVDGAGITDQDKINELLIILCGLENDPCENSESHGHQTRKIFEETYQEARTIFDTFSEKFLILAELAIGEDWSDGRLIVSDERLTKLDATAEIMLQNRRSLTRL